jgi:hypothetical protein
VILFGDMTNGNYVCFAKNMITGAFVQTAAITGAASFSPGSYYDPILGGGSGSQAIDINTAALATIYGKALYPPNVRAAQAWADDPWSFWFRSPFPIPIFGAASALGSAYVPPLRRTVIARRSSPSRFSTG